MYDKKAGSYVSFPCFFCGSKMNRCIFGMSQTMKWFQWRVAPLKSTSMRLRCDKQLLNNYGTIWNNHLTTMEQSLSLGYFYSTIKLLSGLTESQGFDVGFDHGFAFAAEDAADGVFQCGVVKTQSLLCSA